MIAESSTPHKWHKHTVDEFSTNSAPVLSHTDWNFAGQDTRFSTHGIHTYVAAMIPSLARQLIEMYVRPGGSVLDPFCGGGAVLVETVRSGRHAYGSDINHLAVLVSKAKTTHMPSKAIQFEARNVLRRAYEYDGPSLSFPKSAYVEFWFKDYMLQPLTALHFAIDSIHDDNHQMKTLFQVILSATVRNVSLTYRNEVRLRRMKPLDEESFNPDVFGIFNKYVTLAQERVASLPVGISANIKQQDARILDMPNSSVDSIICSPPYGDERNGVNYTQFAKNMLYWLGFSQESIRDSKSRSLGWGNSERTLPPSSTLFSSLNRISDNPTAVKEAIAFYSDYYNALIQMARAVKHRMIIVIGNRVLHKNVFDNARITIELVDALGIPLEASHSRKLPTKRLPKMREHGAGIDRETILIFSK